MRVAPADMVVHTRDDLDVTGTLAGIPVGTTGGKETMIKIVVLNGQRL